VSVIWPLTPEHEALQNLCVGEYRAAALDYAEKAKNRSERERQAEVKNITGAFTGSYCLSSFYQYSSAYLDC